MSCAFRVQGSGLRLSDEGFSFKALGLSGSKVLEFRASHEHHNRNHHEKSLCGDGDGARDHYGHDDYDCDGPFRGW